jgi:Putative lumazine-binding
MEALTTPTTSTDQAAIVATALDYFEGWFDGDPARMERALHPELAKRPGDAGPGSLGTLTAQEMIDATAAGIGRTRDVPDRQIRVEVVDVFGDIASAVIRSAVYHEYIHLVRTPDGWKIANALWQWMPGHER